MFETKGNFIFYQLPIEILLWDAGWKAWEAKEEGGVRDGAAQGAGTCPGEQGSGAVSHQH